MSWASSGADPKAETQPTTSAFRPPRAVKSICVELPIPFIRFRPGHSIVGRDTHYEEERPRLK